MLETKRPVQQIKGYNAERPQMENITGTKKDLRKREESQRAEGHEKDVRRINL